MPKHHLLVIAGEQDQANRIIGWLEVPAWNVTSAHDLPNALRKVRHENIDLVVSLLPPNSAEQMDLPAVLRDVSPLVHLPVIVVTDSDDIASQVFCLDSGADACLTGANVKPDLLLATARRLLLLKQRYDQLTNRERILTRELESVARRLTELRTTNEQLKSLSRCDPLTSLLNVRCLRELLAAAFSSAQRYERPLSLMMIDLDHFKKVNDTHGHPVGDAYLCDFARLLKENVRRCDTPARVGGEEFAVLLPDTDAKMVHRLAQRLVKIIRQGHFGPNESTVTASIGVATFDGQPEINSSDELLRASDIALYRAKQAGRDQVACVARRSASKQKSTPAESALE